MLIIDIPLEKIKIDSNVRSEYNDLEELAGSIKSFGLISPITVSEEYEGYHTLIVGHRRYYACKSLSWKTITAIVKNVDNRKLTQLTENVQRSGLTRYESSAAVHELLKELNIDTRQLAINLNKYTEWVKDREDYYLICNFLKSKDIDYSSMTYRITHGIAKQPHDTWMMLAEKLVGNKYVNNYLVDKDINKILNKGFKRNKIPYSKVSLDKVRIIKQRFPMSKLSDLRYSITFISEEHKREILNVLENLGGAII